MSDSSSLRILRTTEVGVGGYVNVRPKKMNSVGNSTKLYITGPLGLAIDAFVAFPHVIIFLKHAQEK